MHSSIGIGLSTLNGRGVIYKECPQIETEKDPALNEQNKILCSKERVSNHIYGRHIYMPPNVFFDRWYLPSLVISVGI